MYFFEIVTAYRQSLFFHMERGMSGHHVDTLSLTKADAKVKAVWPSH